MTTFDKVVELKALESDDKNRYIEILQYAFLVIIDTKEYQDGTIKYRLGVLTEAFKGIEGLVVNERISSKRMYNWNEVKEV